MLIAIDFDGTLTADPGMWFTMLPQAIAHGHKLVTVTSRRESFENRQTIEKLMREVLGETWPIVFAYDQPKRMAAAESGHYPDVWIDDQPHMIGYGGESLEVVGVFENELRHALEVLRQVGASGDRTSRLIDRLETVLGK